MFSPQTIVSYYPQAFARDHARKKFGHDRIKVLCHSVLHFTDPDKNTTHIGTNYHVIRGCIDNNMHWIDKNLNDVLDTCDNLQRGSRFRLSLSLSLVVCICLLAQGGLIDRERR